MHRQMMLASAGFIHIIPTKATIDYVMAFSF